LTSPELLAALLGAPRVYPASLQSVTTDQGVYALWFAGPPSVCMKVGIAGPRRGKGVRERLNLHYSSNPAGSVLAKHLAADVSSPWVIGKSLDDRATRRAFLTELCYFQVVATPGLSRTQLLALESWLIGKLKPCYVGRVRHGRAG